MAQTNKKDRRRARAQTSAATLNATSRTWWDARSEPQRHGVCLVVLLVLGVLFAAPVLFSSKSLIGGDIVQWRAMAESSLAYEEETGERALWAPNPFGGMPAFMISYADQIPQIDDVATLLRPLLWPLSHFLFLLTGIYFLVFFLTRSTWSGVLAASAYGLTTYLTIILPAGHNTKFIALCFAPWLVLAFAYALRKPKLLSGLLFAIALAANLRANHVQITYYIAFLMGVWWIVEAVGAVRHGRLRSFGMATGFLALGSVLGILMVAQPYLVNAEYSNFTIRGAATGGAASDGLDWTYAMAWSQGWGELVTLAIADAYGGSALYWGPKTFTGGPHYVGGIVLMLAALALWKVRRNAVWAFGIAAFLMTLFSLGEHLEALNRLMFNVFPLFSIFRVPETWLSAVAFALAVLAGFGLWYAGRPEASPEAEAQKTRSLYIAAGAAVGLSLVLILMKGVFFDFERPNEAQRITQQIMQQRPDLSPQNPEVQQAVQQEVARRQEARVDAFSGDAWRTLIFLALAGGLIVLYRRGTTPAWMMQAGLALLVMIDLLGVDRRYFNEDVLRTSEVAEAEIPMLGFDRFILEQQEAAGGPGRFRTLSLEGLPDRTSRPAYHYETLTGYHGAKLRLYQDFLEHVLNDPATGLPSENALSLMGTRYVVALRLLPGMNIAYQDEQTGFLVLENPDVLPRAFFVGATEVVETSEATWERLRSPSFNPRQTALLPEPIPFETTPIGPASTAEVELETFTPDEITWSVRTDAPRLLVASEVYYPAGWNAYLDDEPVPIYRADYLLRAVPVEAGEHTLAMRFEPRTHTLGLWLTGLSTLLVYGSVLALLGLAWQRRKQSEEADVQEGEVEEGR